MELKKRAVAGTLESSDVMIMIGPNPGKGISIRLRSNVLSLFGKAIERTVRELLQEFDIQDADVEVNDKGALDYVIRARMQCAICRAAEIRYDWGKGDANV